MFDNCASRTYPSRKSPSTLPVKVLPKVTDPRVYLFDILDRPSGTILLMYKYDPASVTIAKGGTVTWNNGSTVQHSATFDPSKAVNKANVSLPSGVAPWDSGLIDAGKTATPEPAATMASDNPRGTSQPFQVTPGLSTFSASGLTAR